MSDYLGKQPVRNDGEYSSPDNEQASSSGLIGSERSAAISVATSTQRVTAKPGDEDKIALDVAISDGDGNSINKDNPLPVYNTDAPGAEIEDYDKAVDVAKNGGSANHDYTTGAEFRSLNVECSSAGLASFELQVETAPASGTFATVMRKFNSVSTPNVVFALKKPKAIASGTIIRVIKVNLDNQNTDLDSVINGVEV
jgi:hypothetical protein